MCYCRCRVVMMIVMLVGVICVLVCGCDGA